MRILSPLSAVGAGILAVVCCAAAPVAVGLGGAVGVAALLGGGAGLALCAAAVVAVGLVRRRRRPDAEGSD